MCANTYILYYLQSHTSSHFLWSDSVVVALNGIPGTNICMITEIGDNHRGYLGYRNPDDNLTIINDGAIDIVVDNWIDRTSTNTQD